MKAADALKNLIGWEFPPFVSALLCFEESVKIRVVLGVFFLNKFIILVENSIVYFK